MTTQIQRRRGTTVQHSTFTGAEGEITIDTTKDTAVVHDGATAGGHPLAKEDGSTLTNVDINSGTIDGTVIGGTTPAAVSGTTGQFSTSLNVDGTVTADGLTVDGNATISSASPTLVLEDTDGAAQDDARLQVGASIFNIKRDSDSVTRLSVGLTTGDISFYEDTGTTPKFFWDASAEALGIGTNNPAEPLHVEGSIRASATSPLISLWNSAGSDRYGYIYGQSGSTTFAAEGASRPMLFSVAGTERMRITSTGNVGIGTTSPQAQLHVEGDLRVRDSSGNTDVYFGGGTGQASITVYGPSQTTNFSILNNNSYAYLTTNGGNGIQYRARGSGTHIFTTTSSDTERMRIDASGNLLVGTTSAYSVSKTTIDYSSNAAFGITLRDTGSAVDGAMAYFVKGGAVVGSIISTTSATAYNTSSDYRLKEDVQPMVGASNRVLALNPVNFAWKADGTRVDGFLAHEAQAVVPEAVTGTKDAMRTEEYEVTPAVEATYDEDGNELTPYVPAVMGTREVPDYQGIDQSKLVPLLTAALQEALNEIAALKDRVASLEV